MQGLRPLYRYFDFKGRSGRAEYWQWFALSTGCGWIVQALQATAEPKFGTPASLMVLIYAAATIVPQCSVATRRLHDRGRPGWLYAVPVVIMGLAVWLLIRGRIAIDQTGDTTSFTGGLIVMGVGVAAFVAFVIECARPGDVGVNKYGAPDAVADVLPVSTQTTAPRVAIISGNAEPIAQPAAIGVAADWVTQLDRLDDLRSRGVLSEAEFTTAKARLLDSPSEQTATEARSVVAHILAQAPLAQSSIPTEPTDWQPTSEVWQKRFAFFDQRGLANTPEWRKAIRALAPWERVRLTNSFLGLLLGPFYFLYLGLWRPALVLTVAGILLGFITNPIVEQLFPGATESTFGPYQRAYAIGLQALYGVTAIPLYYLQQRYGIRTWNPFRRSIVNG